MTDIQLAIDNLDNHTLALCKNGKIIASDKRGVAPMIDFINENRCLSGFCAADKVVGKAAAMLFVKAGICEVYAGVLSESGKQMLENHGITVTFGKLTDMIVNRSGTGICPMENAVFSINSIDDGFAAITQTLHNIIIAANKHV